jgi:plasmid replication initiation protein
MADIFGDLNNRKVVRMSHALNFARYDISIVALDILYALISQITKEDKELNCYHTSVSEFERLLGRKLNRKSLTSAQHELLTEPIIFMKDKSVDPYAWCKTFDLNSRLGIIKIELHPQLTKHLLQLPKFFVLGSLTEVLKLNSKYSKRMYFVFAQFVELGSFEMSVGVLRNILQLPCPDSEEIEYGYFKKRVLAPSVKNITDLTTIRVDYSEMKFGRRITDIKFVIYKPKVPKKEKPKKVIGKSGVMAAAEWVKNENAKDAAIDTEIVTLQLSS